MALPAGLAAMIVVGAWFLRWPGCQAPGQSLGMLDAVFASASAVTGAGLALRPAFWQFSTAGQVVLLALMEAGLLAYLAAGCAAAHRLHGWMTATEEAEASRWPGAWALTRQAWMLSLVAQAAGAAALAAAEPGDVTGGAWWNGLFHAASAWANVGLVLTDDGLAPGRSGWPAHVVLLPLMLLGGVGYPVLRETAVWAAARLRRGAASTARLGAFTRMTLTATAGLYVLGVGMLMLADLKPYVDETFKQGMAYGYQAPRALDVPVAGRMVARASFVSVSARGGGLAVDAMEALRPAGVAGVLLLMLTGGVPGGSATGVGTLALAAGMGVWWARGRHGRRPAAGVVVALGGAAMATAALAVGAFYLLSLSEPFPPAKLLFEAVSAAGGVGLSQGVVGDMTAFGRGVLVVTMGLGRCLPLVMLSAGLGRVRAGTPRDGEAG